MLDKTKKPPTIETLTGTKDKVKQADVLLNLANIPIVDLVIRFDPRNGQITLATIGGPLEVAAIYAIMDKAREMLHKKELEAVAQKEQTPQPVPDQPGEA
jgi:hypothetical protein